MGITLIKLAYNGVNIRAIFPLTIKSVKEKIIKKKSQCSKEL